MFLWLWADIFDNSNIGVLLLLTLGDGYIDEIDVQQ